MCYKRADNGFLKRKLDYIEQLYKELEQNAINFEIKFSKEFFDLKNLTLERAKALRFQRWDEDLPNLWLFPLWYIYFVGHTSFAKFAIVLASLQLFL